jgi:NAD-dependent dihydropyrimidine dehydrogenase PreA subunit
MMGSDKMTSRHAADRPLVLVCTCAHYDLAPAGTLQQTLDGLSRAGLEAEVVADLCGLAASRDARLGDWAKARPLSIVACYPRTIRWLFHAAGAPLAAEQVRFFNMRTQPADQIASGLLEGHRPGRPHSLTSPAKAEGWIPWFPVVDYDRCKNCKQCLGFCLFGVYTLSAQSKVEVTRPTQCKTNCPACAKACPHRAIIFPKYTDPPINGAEVVDAPGPGQAAAGELGRVLQGNLHEVLRQRAAQGTSASQGQAVPSIETIRKELDIPPEVLASLSPAQWRRLGQKASASEGAGPAEDVTDRAGEGGGGHG